MREDKEKSIDELLHDPEALQRLVLRLSSFIRDEGLQDEFVQYLDNKIEITQQKIEDKRIRDIKRATGVPISQMFSTPDDAPLVVADLIERARQGEQVDESSVTTTPVLSSEDDDWDHPDATPFITGSKR